MIAPDRLAALHALQDDALAAAAAVGTGFYLTGGAAAARGYLHHRLADALELEASDDPRFGLWCVQVVNALAGSSSWKAEVLRRQPRFVRLTLARGEWKLPVELSNHAFPHVGELTVHPVLGRLSSVENLVADLVTALADRVEPEDLADLWGFCCRERFSPRRALELAREKAAAVFPIDLARVVSAATRADWELVRWTDPPPAEGYLGDLRHLAEQLLLLKV
jgi:hypothetical protein